MSHPSQHHNHSSATQPAKFSDAEWAEFQKSDIHAGGAVVKLMTAIFVIGLILYSTIAVIVSA